jgi:hypothetical protein
MLIDLDRCTRCDDCVRMYAPTTTIEIHSARPSA